VMPAAAGAARVPYRTFLIYNVLGGLIWGVGYCVLGYAAGSAYSAIESRVGAGLAIAVAAVVVAGLSLWAVRRHRAAASRRDPGGAGDAIAAVGLAARPPGLEPGDLLSGGGEEPADAPPAGPSRAGAEPGEE
jgi:membrane-associated protein